MRAFTVSVSFNYPSCLLLHPSSSSSSSSTATTFTDPSIFPSKLITSQTSLSYLILSKSRICSNSDSVSFDDDNDDFDEFDDDDSYTSVDEDSDSNDVFIQIKKLGTNSRRIRSKISINATLETIWNILTDYEKLADFIPGLAVSKLLDKKENFARLYQIGQQDLALGLKFNAKAILDCFEKEVEIFGYGKRRDIEFKMTEGDFQLFEGKWSIEQVTKSRSEECNDSVGEELETSLSYFVDVKPKLWLPVHLVEGRLCKEIQTNLSCIREQAQKMTLHTQYGLE
ncbi:uncharacterized protein LOC126654163 [Mercurialis annua]|uniref:uncharacterized protein LOC126654163 n=1 Tax=Mercurialis annua TaxID=3986 RepID=UPI002160F746|nr:uncharacterized protein LOC126654163 [Mercurialis annua]